MGETLTQEDLRVAYDTADYWWNRHGHLKDRDDYREAAHDAIVHALKTYNPKEKRDKRSWMKHIISYRMRDLLRGRQAKSDVMLRQARIDMEIPEDYAKALAVHQATQLSIEQKIDLEKASRGMTDIQNFVYTGFMTGLRQAEIARILGCTEKNVAYIRKRVIRHMRKRLGEPGVSNGG
jgi:RNA polymerase sigma factor (sigma-70 family)